VDCDDATTNCKSLHRKKLHGKIFTLLKKAEKQLSQGGKSSDKQ